uniref:Uncharacterized protein n=1 Tax=Candidatus Kentrum sp. DK TaxID=2126562 RepID=A0A450SFJ7_9GAMM|nr:MAG: hypothetical protein BECKDK2373C_GA0170839_103232 [Candidatus Kentron sp. DK]
MRKVVICKARRRRHNELYQACATQQMAAFRIARREPAKRTKVALQPLKRVHYSLRAVPCLGTPGWL